MKLPIVAASIFSADFGRLAEEVAAAGADHLLVQCEPSSTVAALRQGPRPNVAGDTA